MQRVFFFTRDALFSVFVGDRNPWFWCNTIKPVLEQYSFLEICETNLKIDQKEKQTHIAKVRSTNLKKNSNHWNSHNRETTLWNCSSSQTFVKLGFMNITAFCLFFPSWKFFSGWKNTWLKERRKINPKQMNFVLLFASIILVAVTYRCIVSIILRRQFAENALLLKRKPLPPATRINWPFWIENIYSHSLWT